MKRSEKRTAIPRVLLKIREQNIDNENKAKQNDFMNKLIQLSLAFLVMASCVSIPKEEQPGEPWELVWNDEFDNTGLPDPEKWGYEYWPPYMVNGEFQSYQGKRLENTRVEDGNLIIEARLDRYNGSKYSSARMHTRDRGEWLYGRIEVKAILPEGTGTWPAIWMLPVDDQINGLGWPASGEIDIMEHVGFDQDNVHASIHTNDYNWPSGTQSSSGQYIEGVAEGFHLYVLEWSPEKLDVLVDDEIIHTYENEGRWQAWPFDNPFYLILNIAIGGNWGGQEGVDESIFPQQMVVVYVRVYQNPALY